MPDRSQIGYGINCEDCGFIVCICGETLKHEPDCKRLVAITSAVGIECERGCTGFAKLAVQGAGIDISPPDPRLQSGPPKPSLDAGDHPKVTAFQLAASEAVCHDYYGDLLDHSLKTSKLFTTRTSTD